MKNPITWWNERVVRAVQKRYKYSLVTYARRHRYEQTKGGLFLPIGVVLWIVLPIIGAASGYYWLDFTASSFIFLGVVFMPWVAGFWEMYKLKPKLTLTMNIIPDDPENTYPKRLTLRGVEFGSPMQSKEELVDFMKGQNARMTSKAAIKTFKSLRTKSPTVLDADAENLLRQAKENNTRLYPMYAIGDEVPSLVMFANTPEAVLRPRQERVGLSYGFGKVRHATITALECRPIKTTVQVKEKMVDVEFALFAPFITQHDFDVWLENGSWFVPNRVTQEVATWVKQNADVTKNATTFGVLEMQRDTARTGIRAIKVDNRDTSMQAKSSEDYLTKLRQRPKKRADYVQSFLYFALGVIVTVLYFHPWG